MRMTLMKAVVKVCQASCLAGVTAACVTYAPMAVRTGLPRPALPVECALELIDASQDPTGTATGNELIGSVTVNVSEGIGPLDPQVKALVRPEACKLGGTALSSLSSREVHTFSVWAPRVASTPASF